MKAMILSGGRGKRLRPVTDTIPKPLILINKRPLIEWKINYLKKFGIKDIIICSGYKGKKIKHYEGAQEEFFAAKAYAEAARFKHMKELLEEIKKILEK